MYTHYRKITSSHNKGASTTKGVHYVKDWRVGIQEALNMSADDRHWYWSLLIYTGVPQVVCKCDSRESHSYWGSKPSNINEYTQHMRTAGCSCSNMCVQHALKSHTNRQLQETCCECVIVILWGSVSHKCVIKYVTRLPVGVCVYIACVCVECNGMSVHACICSCRDPPRHKHNRWGLVASHAGHNITANHVFVENSISSDTLGWVVLWHRALSHPVNCVSNWKIKRRMFFYNGALAQQNAGMQVGHWWE